MHRTPDSECPACHSKITAAANLDDASLVPSPGDVSVCIECAQILTMNDDLTVRAYSWDEVFALEIEARDPLMNYRAAVLTRLEGKNGQ